jgi:phospholipid transport system substrate-binding protein
MFPRRTRSHPNAAGSARSRAAAVALALALLAATPVAVRAQGGAAAPVEALDNGLLQIMHAGASAPFATRARDLTPIVQQAFDLPQILQESVGPRFAAIPPAQQAELLQAFTTFTVANYVANFDSFSGERFEVLPETRRVGPDTVVQTRIVPTTGQPTRIDYVVRGDKIVDILLDGSISRVAVERSDFRSLIGSGDPSPLIAMLRSKAAGLAAGAKG